MPPYLPLLFSSLLGAASALPSTTHGSSLGSRENILLFDAPAYETSTCPIQHLSTIQAYTYTNGSVDEVVATFSAFAAASGIDIDEQGYKILQERSRWFATTPVGGKTVEVQVDGCSRGFSVGKTAPARNGSDDVGMAEGQGSFGACERGHIATGRAVLGKWDKRAFTNTVYKSGKKGWGVISDIDDTIKITGGGLDAIKATLIEEATPVAGMPALYSTITDLIDPAWIYLTGSPWQLYSMLHDFIHTEFSASTGPILMKNLTYTGVEGLLEFLAAGTSLEYKAGRIDDIHAWYPGKMYLGIGDSSGYDPEVYAYAYRQYGPEWMKCIWIHVVEEGNNTDARWEEAFKGIPETAYYLYSDPEELNPAALAEGACF
ncbi:hypothetical protein ASPCAL02895 [Aspergillus calidoustus]|uniref:Phosphatidate phosphatase APP1 catalytic domain-containing protein n=1 Tax=Aspergillus calidoustus TaxID=454130 RepID=A0A0U5GLN8_ASPCI|nr:hypothetical protein ASPCAL02895 [Aspergillus calidoustus]